MGSESRMEAVECNPCTFWDVAHGIKPLAREENRKCMDCPYRLKNYPKWVEKQGE